jgi:hypothetical protein
MGRIERPDTLPPVAAVAEKESTDAFQQSVKEQTQPVKVEVVEEDLETKPVLFLELLDGTEATFRTPTVFDLKRAETISGAIVNNQFQPAYFVEIAQLTCLDWGCSTKMPRGKALDAEDYQEVVALFTEYAQHCQEQAELVGYEVVENGSHSVQLNNGAVLVFRRLTAEDMERAGKMKGGNADINARLAAAACISWGGESITWAIAYKQIESLDVPNYMRIMQALSKFFRGDSSRTRRRRFL